MASSVDATFPADGTKVSKATMRAQFLTIKTELTALQQKIAPPGRDAFNDHPDRSEIEAMIRRATERNDRLAFQIAMGTVDL